MLQSHDSQGVSFNVPGCFLHPPVWFERGNMGKHKISGRFCCKFLKRTWQLFVQLDSVTKIEIFFRWDSEIPGYFQNKMKLLKSHSHCFLYFFPTFFGLQRSAVISRKSVKFVMYITGMILETLSATQSAHKKFLTLYFILNLTKKPIKRLSK